MEDVESEMREPLSPSDDPDKLGNNTHGGAAAGGGPARSATPGRSAAPDAGADDDDEGHKRGYTAAHLSAVMRPVMLTMTLSSVAVGQIRDPAQDAAISSGLSMYLVYDDTSSAGSSGASSADIGQAIINAIVIVSVIAAATFVLVLCYKFRLLKCMIAYLIFACMNLLGYSGGFMFLAAVQRFRVILDFLTLALVMWNFAVVGVVAVFWQKGVPRRVTQGYLVAVSVIMAWILTKLPASRRRCSRLSSPPAQVSCVTARMTSSSGVRSLVLVTQRVAPAAIRGCLWVLAAGVDVLVSAGHAGAVRLVRRVDAVRAAAAAAGAGAGAAGPHPRAVVRGRRERRQHPERSGRRCRRGRAREGARHICDPETRPQPRGCRCGKRRRGHCHARRGGGCSSSCCRWQRQQRPGRRHQAVDAPRWACGNGRRRVWRTAGSGRRR
jgi:hypothetical protein